MKKIFALFQLASLMFVFATCSSDSIERTVLQDVLDIDLTVTPEYDQFLLSWSQPKMRTNKSGAAALWLSEHCYDIYLKGEGENSFIYLKSEYGTESFVSRDEIYYTIGGGYSHVIFGIKLQTDTQVSDFLTISDSYDLTTQSGSGHQNIVITVSAAGDNGVVTGGGTYENNGHTIILTAVPNDGYEFDKWSDGATANPRELVAFEDMNLVAYFYECDKNLYPAGLLSNGWEVRGKNQYRDIKRSIDIVHNSIESNNTFDVQFISPCWENVGKKGDVLNLMFEVKYEGEAESGMLRIIPDKLFRNQTPTSQIFDDENSTIGGFESEIIKEWEWVRMNYICIIGPEDTDSVRLDIDFGNIPGTYSFRNVELEVGDKLIDKYWCKDE